MDHRYEVYGLRLRSTEPLRGLLPALPGLAPDLDVIWCRDECDRFSSRQWSALPMTQQPHSVMPVTLWRSDGDGRTLLRLRYSIDHHVCDFVFDEQEHKLLVLFPSAIKRGRLRTFLLGSVVSSILRLRGTICLHASVVSVEHEAIAFAGRKGAGKSTIAAALSQRGFSLLTDDIAAITRQHGRFVVHPGEMDIRLLQSSVGALYGQTETPATLGSVDEKVRIRLSQEASAFGRFANRVLPLAAIYLFQDAHSSTSSPAISALRAGDRYMALFQHLYGFWLDKEQTHAQDFKALAELANTVPIYTINRFRDLDQLPMVCDAIRKNLIEQDHRSVLKQVS